MSTADPPTMASWLKALGGDFLKHVGDKIVKTKEEKLKEIDDKLNAKLGLEEAPDRQPTPKAEVAELLAWSGIAACEN